MSTPTQAPVSVEPAPRQRRSVFGNYSSDNPRVEPTPDHEPSAVALAADEMPGGTELALTRSFVHQFLARAFDYPDANTWAWLSSDSTQEGLAAAVDALEPPSTGALHTALSALLNAGLATAFDAVHDDYILAIGHAARGSCPINEIEYGDIKADPLFQPHRLADLGAFYRAFGMEPGTESGERLDHLSVEFEFMSVLTAQEAGFLGAAADREALAVCRDAQRKFLREHLGRWTPAFTRRLRRAVGDRTLGLLADLALAFIEGECARLHVPLGSAELVLRPADEAASLCDGCGLPHTLPGATGAATP
ncbi:MAG: molecular chaperone TorD family protein [Verrucomicrobia bacterium]|nr:molecular chaperone TorD family protein [Verrucomicrobiota bacterium]